MSKPQVNDASAIRPLLRKVGLDDREIDVYVALLGMKVGAVSAIAAAAKQQRSNTYLFLRALKDKGLVSEVERGKVLHFVAEPPERLLAFLQNKEQEIKDTKVLLEGVLPFLSSLTKPLAGKPRVTLLSGLAGMRQVYRDTLSQEISGCFNVEKLYTRFGEDYLEAFFGKDAQLYGHDLVVDNPGGRHFCKKWAHTEGYEVRVLPVGMDFEGDIIIFGDTIALFAHDEEMTVIRIENQQLADTLRAWLKGLWTISRTADQLKD